MVDSNGILTRVVTIISTGGQETLQKPPVFSCADQTHEPYRVMPEPLTYEITSA